MLLRGALCPRESPSERGSKTPVFRLLKCCGKVYTEIVPGCSNATVQSIIGRLAPEAGIHSDGWCGCEGLLSREQPRVRGCNFSADAAGMYYLILRCYWLIPRRCIQVVQSSCMLAALAGSPVADCSLM